LPALLLLAASALVPASLSRDVLGLKESKESIFEYVTVVDKNRLLEKFGRMES
jgi:hypothetical protein